jgi:hypothetical protein
MARIAAEHAPRKGAAACCGAPRAACQRSATLPRVFAVSLAAAK